jgi:3-dehydroquinate synthase
MIELQDYSIQFQDKSFAELKAQLLEASYSKIFVLVDNNTQAHCLPILKEALKGIELYVITIKAGEAHKNIDTCQVIWNALMEQQADRKSVLLNLGGGVIGDMGGFCASTFKRGIDFIQIPTTLLAQVDASIGGKLGIDFGLVKNSIGLFNNPQAVYLYIDFFQTLPKAELYSGYAEIIKHALILNGTAFTQLLGIAHPEDSEWRFVVEESLLVKKTIVEQDPFEKNIRKSLNFGHTIGHAIESLSWETNQPLLHGEAVAIGMITECYLSYKLLDFQKEKVDLISSYLLNIYPKYDLKSLDRAHILRLIQQDKKNEHQQICFTLLKEIGACKINIHASETLILEALDYYQQFVN